MSLSWVLGETCHKSQGVFGKRVTSLWGSWGNMSHRLKSWGNLSYLSGGLGETRHVLGLNDVLSRTDWQLWCVQVAMPWFGLGQLVRQCDTLKMAVKPLWESVTDGNAILNT